MAEYQNIFTRVQVHGPSYPGVPLSYPGEEQQRQGPPLHIHLLGRIGDAQLGPIYLGWLGVTSLFLGFISLSMAGLYAFRGPFWSMPSLFLTRSAAAISIAAINSVGNLGGFVGPYAIGAINDKTGDPMVALFLLSALLAVAFVMIALARLPGRVATAT